LTRPGIVRLYYFELGKQNHTEKDKYPNWWIPTQTDEYQPKI